MSRPKSGAADTMFESWKQLNDAVGLDVESICRDGCKSLKMQIEQRKKNPNFEVERILKSVDVVDKDIIPEPLKTLITSIEIPGNVKVIGDGAFYKCTSLTSVTIGNSVTSIGDGAFYYCTSLTSVTIPDSVTSIGRYAFSYCSGLTNIIIPNSVINIGTIAFNHCTNLENIVFEGKTLEEVKSMEFYPWGIEDMSAIKAESSLNESKHDPMVHYWAHMLDECFHE